MFTTLVALFLTINVAPAAPDGPSKAPQLASDGSTVALTFGVGDKIFFSISHDAGLTFSAPVTVAKVGALALGRHRGPRLAILGGTIVISAITGNARGLPADEDLHVWRSVDDGASWSKEVVVNDVPGAAIEGLHAMTGDGKGTLFAAWLDTRGGKGKALFGARSTDAGLTWSKNVSIYVSPEGSICQCCHPSVAMDATGQVIVMWRNWLHGARDMYLTRSKDGKVFSTPEKLGTGSWQLNACPMDGGGLTITDGRVATVWRRDREIYSAAPGKQEVAIGEGADAALASAANGDYIVWSTKAGIRALLPGSKSPVMLADHGTFPTVTSLPNGRALAAWEDNGKITVRPLP